MRAFILRNIMDLLSPAYAGVMVIYLAFAWFLTDPSFEPTAIYSSEKLTSNYDLILMSMMMMNFFLLILHHFKGQWEPAKRDMLASRLTARRLLWGLIASYVLYFVLCFVLPTYGTALVQQLIYAPQNVRWSVFLLKASAGIAGYTLFWVVIAIWCITRFRNEFVCLIVLAIAYAASQILNLVSHATWFSQYWLVHAAQDDDPGNHWQSALVWIGVTTLGLLLARGQEKTIVQIDVRGPYRKGMLSRLAEWCGADLAMHHYRMMGLASQKLLMFCTIAGLIFLIPLFRRTDVNLLPLAKVYLGAFVPLLFSFNQHFLIKIDRDAGMTHNNFLRAISYPRIIFNRWFVLLFPQLAVQLVFVLIASVLAHPFPLSFVLYILLLNVLWSAANLYFAIATMTNAVANLLLLSFVYMQLRDDVQHLFQSSTLLSQLNFLSVLIQPEFTPVRAIHWCVVAALIVASLLLAFHRLRRVGFAQLQR